jgi:hypothetical protein
MITEDIIRQKLMTDLRWLEAAILAIYRRQTDDEKAAGATKHLNGVGFSGCDSVTGSYMAKWIQGGRHLSGKWVEKAQRIMPKYTRQLLDEAQMKAQRQGVAA